MDIPKTITIAPFFRWYDLWVGVFIDTKNQAIYICPVPMFGIKISAGEKGEG